MREHEEDMLRCKLALLRDSGLHDMADALEERERQGGVDRNGGSSDSDEQQSSPWGGSGQLLPAMDFSETRMLKRLDTGRRDVPTLSLEEISRPVSSLSG